VFPFSRYNKPRVGIREDGAMSNAVSVRTSEVTSQHTVT
jgi:hypothetical protein